jgi:hypothetical protein
MQTSSDSPSERSGRASRSLRRELHASARAQENRELKMIQNPGMDGASEVGASAAASPR